MRDSSHAAVEDLVKEFISEDDLQTFEGWLKYQGDAALTAPEELETRRRSYEEMRERMAANPKVGRMKFRPLISGEHRYAVALREGSDLWLTLWVKRSRKPEFFVFQPRADGDWNPHTSYHLDGTLHMKSYDHKMVATKRQPLTGKFRETESLGAHGGHGSKRRWRNLRSDRLHWGRLRKRTGPYGNPTPCPMLVRATCKPLCPARFRGWRGALHGRPKWLAMHRFVALAHCRLKPSLIRSPKSWHDHVW
jgi:hypothetical protein